MIQLLYRCVLKIRIVNMYREVETTFKDYFYNCYVIDSKSTFSRESFNDFLTQPRSIGILEINQDNNESVDVIDGLNDICKMMKTPCVVFWSSYDNPQPRLGDGWMFLYPNGYENVFKGFVEFSSNPNDVLVCPFCGSIEDTRVECCKCSIPYCLNCFKSLPCLRCPFCEYTINNHIDKVYHVK